MLDDGSRDLRECRRRCKSRIVAERQKHICDAFFRSLQRDVCGMQCAPASAATSRISKRVLEKYELLLLNTSLNRCRSKSKFFFKHSTKIASQKAREMIFTSYFHDFSGFCFTVWSYNSYFISSHWEVEKILRFGENSMWWKPEAATLFDHLIILNFNSTLRKS